MVKHKLMELAEEYEKLHRENSELQESLRVAITTIDDYKFRLFRVINFLEEITSDSTEALKGKAQVLLDGINSDLYGHFRGDE